MGWWTGRDLGRDRRSDYRYLGKRARIHGEYLKGNISLGEEVRQQAANRKRYEYKRDQLLAKNPPKKQAPAKKSGSSCLVSALTAATGTAAMIASWRGWM